MENPRWYSGSIGPGKPRAVQSTASIRRDGKPSLPPLSRDAGLCQSSFGALGSSSNRLLAWCSSGAYGRRFRQAASRSPPGTVGQRLQLSTHRRVSGNRHERHLVRLPGERRHFGQQFHVGKQLGAVVLLRWLRRTNARVATDGPCKLSTRELLSSLHGPRLDRCRNSLVVVVRRQRLQA